MTEAEWLEASDPRPMLGFLDGRLISHWQKVLFACACWRRMRHAALGLRGVRKILSEQDGIPLGERYASGLISEADLHSAAEYDSWEGVFGLLTEFWDGSDDLVSLI